jgi:hypothetical protein
MPNNVLKMLTTNATVLIHLAPCKSFSLFLLLHLLEYIKAIRPPKKTPRSTLMMDHASQSRILGTSGAETTCFTGGREPVEGTLAVSVAMGEDRSVLVVKRNYYFVYRMLKITPVYIDVFIDQQYSSPSIAEY